MRVLSLFDLTGNMLKPWLEAGYECHLFDWQHPKGIRRREDGMWTYGLDLEKPNMTIFQDYTDVSFISCFPPCTDLSVSGARWMKGKGLRALATSIEYFATSTEVCELLEAPYMIENPRSTISTYWRAPDHSFHPCHYSGYVHGDEMFTKETNLWVGNGFVMPPKQMINDLFDEPDRTYIHHQAPGPERANIRSATPMGFAKAVFLFNEGKV
jgi:hypothetical protein